MNFKAALALPKMAGSAQTYESLSLIWIVWSTLYVYLWRRPQHFYKSSQLLWKSFRNSDGRPRTILMLVEIWNLEFLNDNTKSKQIGPFIIRKKDFHWSKSASKWIFQLCFYFIFYRPLDLNKPPIDIGETIEILSFRSLKFFKGVRSEFPFCIINDFINFFYRLLD